MHLEGELSAAVRAVRAEPRQSRGDLFLQLGIDKGDAVSILQDELLDPSKGRSTKLLVSGSRPGRVISPAEPLSSYTARLLRMSST